MHELGIYVSVIKCVVVKSQNDVDKILKACPQHWIKDVIEHCGFDEVEELIVPIYNENGKVITCNLIDNTKKIIAGGEYRIAYYMPQTSQLLCQGKNWHPVFAFEDDEFYWAYVGSDEAYL